MGTAHSKRQHMYETIHLSDVPVTSISNDDSTEDENDEIIDETNKKSKWMSFELINRMRHITAAIDLSQQTHIITSDITPYTPSHITPTNIDTFTSDLEILHEFELLAQSDCDEEYIQDKTQDVNTDGNGDENELIMTEKEEIMITKGMEEIPSIHHKCWFVGNNQYNQFADGSTKNILNLCLMKTLPNNIYINKIISVHNGATRILYNNNKYMIIAANYNGYDQLTVSHIEIIYNYWCINNNDDHHIPNDVSQIIVLFIHQVTTLNQFISTNNGEFDIQLISGGIASNQLFILTQQNEVYAASTTPYTNSYKLKRIQYFEHHDVELQQIESTSYITIFLSKTGQLYSCDGIGADGEDNIDILDNNNNIKLTIFSVACGADHTLALTTNGNVYSFGFNGCGQLGLMPIYKFAVYQPTLIQYLIDNNINIVHIGCGSYHNVLLDKNGKIYCFGGNTYYQCGNGDNKQNVYIPQLNKTLHDNDIKIVDIKCGEQHNVIQSDKKDYYLWGNNTWNQCLVYDDDKKYVEIPTKYECEMDIYTHIFPGEIIMIEPGWKETRIVST